MSNFYEYSNKIKPQEFDEYMTENSDFMIYISDKYDLTYEEFENNFKDKIEKITGIKFKYNEYVTKMLLESIVSATSEYKRVYGLGAMYPDIAFSVLTAAFSQALFQNRQFVTVIDVYNAIKTSKRIYPDSIIRELILFRDKFKDVVAQEGVVLPVVDIKEISIQE